MLCAFLDDATGEACDGLDGYAHGLCLYRSPLRRTRGKSTRRGTAIDISRACGDGSRAWTDAGHAGSGLESGAGRLAVLGADRGQPTLDQD